MTSRPILLSCCLFAACAEAGQTAVEVPLYAAGSDVGDAFPVASGVPVTLARAELAFGPLYLCAGSQAGELCDTARLEWLESTIVDLLDSQARTPGELVGVTGRVRSYMYDLGLTSVLTQANPLVLPAAEELGGVSIVLEGSADVAGVAVPFSAAVPIQQTTETELGAPVIRKRSDETFAHEVTQGEPGLLLEFDPRPLLENVDFAALIAEQGDACAVGCEAPLRIQPDTQAYRAIRNAAFGARPRFTWGFLP
jgi:hypothetical protein